MRSFEMYVTGIRPANDKWKKMKGVWDSCSKAGVAVPDEVIDFFDGEDPDEAGIEVKIKTKEYSAELVYGLEVDVDSIPKGVKKIRFTVHF